jgi:hypothetical protein
VIQRRRLGGTKPLLAPGPHLFDLGSLRLDDVRGQRLDFGVLRASLSHTCHFHGAFVVGDHHIDEPLVKSARSLLAGRGRGCNERCRRC